MTTSSIAPVAPVPAKLGEARACVTALLVAVMWLDVLHDSTAVATPHAAWWLALAGLAAQLAFTAFEALAAAAAWRLAGYRARWSALAPRILAASAAETLAVSIAAGRARLAISWASLLAGPRALRAPGAEHGLAAAFAAVGLLALARVVLSAWLQARAARASFTTALRLVLALWIVSRLAVWWMIDLLQGRSFQP
jgi:hypothetical protein